MTQPPQTKERNSGKCGSPGIPGPEFKAVLGNFDFFVGAPVTTGANT
jgi:hypothetical protein